MNILIAPNAFKNSINALETGEIIKKAWSKVRPSDNVVIKPMADGGDGFAKIVGEEKNGEKVIVSTKNPLGLPHEGYYYKVNEATAILDLASNCGMQTLKDGKLNALESNTEGLGIVIRKAIEDGCKEIIIGLGGSASTDFGLGAIYALGANFISNDGNEIIPNGGNLHQIKSINLESLHQTIKDIHFFMAIDVDNVLLGDDGAAAVFAPQKGASKIEVKQLDNHLEQIAHITEKITGKEVLSMQGGGAAGGTAAGFWAYLDAQPMQGSQFMIKVMGLKQEIEKADVVITSEGRLDQQTLNGKIPSVIAEYGNQFFVPTICLVGSNTLDFNDDHPFYSIFSINQRFDNIEKAIQETKVNLEHTTFQVAKIFHLGKNKSH
ncbi:glycerate kinase [Flammeovirga aprica]|uniref:Glycerate kinase n=1 Tax=Flammeovirga aprica JL-4 TaxID=694437 RepID=A0A7X9RYX8_9BACT|nr:glycerate kinase [Flammeovirga aprica]NME71281.1 glycerate kinase [Flammeovirga aprica JL-4]